jgi:hypothetical protein
MEADIEDTIVTPRGRERDRHTDFWAPASTLRGASGESV